MSWNLLRIRWLWSARRIIFSQWLLVCWIEVGARLVVWAISFRIRGGGLNTEIMSDLFDASQCVMISLKQPGILVLLGYPQSGWRILVWNACYRRLRRAFVVIKQNGLLNTFRGSKTVIPDLCALPRHCYASFFHTDEAAGPSWGDRYIALPSSVSVILKTSYLAMTRESNGFIFFVNHLFVFPLPHCSFKCQGWARSCSLRYMRLKLMHQMYESE